ncbi:hypothetical protein CC86DRAFT_303192 [Ophiobolus disseminans]|uniref:Pentatricopeptide repeat-containing protein-mitochondrial domain-containing protein n=1 Tax=Ophiobolus disseminans TaxID=1469910 RepID=A0A6A6ZJV4_9PLEO|nr:hypothetical protein CC86DRAFT_303192 [Ophiobolus disseminans]
MPPRPFVNDALWRCLCSSFPANVSSTAIPRISASRALRNAPQNRDSSTQIRAYNSFSAPSTTNDPFPSLSQLDTPTSGAHPRASRSTPNPARKAPLAQLPTNILYEHLRDEGAKGRWDDVFSICRVLVKDRGEAPNKEMYTAILHSFVSSTNGTAGKVRKVLEEMGFWAETDAYGGQARVDLDARGCECVLEVLAVHPDYLLRTEILEYMKSRWFTLSDRGHNFVVAGMLRERHFEQALETLEDMVRKKVRIESWLFDKAMWILLEYGEVEEAFYILNLKDGLQRPGTGSAKLNSALWGALLDAAAHRQLHDAVKMVWTRQVEPGYLKPGTGACQSILALAARHGDVHLATDVFRVLTERETTFTSHHYELLITTYLNADDLSAALSVILIMVDANLKVSAGTCRPLFWYLRSEKPDESSRPLAAFHMLQDFEASGRKVPTAAINACIQASITLERFEEGIEIYKALHTVSHSGPDTETFNVLFRGCYINIRKELAMFFANEMIQLGLKPNRLTYDRLITVCLQADDLEDALLYYEEMRSTRAKPSSTEIMKPRRATWEALIMRCAAKGDERAVALLRDYKQEQEEPRAVVEKAVRQRFEESKAPSRPDREIAQAGVLGTGEVNLEQRPGSDPSNGEGANATGDGQVAPLAEVPRKYP